jgi:hypothetical protein
MLTGRIPAGGGNENRVVNSSVAEETATKRSGLRISPSDDLMASIGRSCLGLDNAMYSYCIVQ